MPSPPSESILTTNSTWPKSSRLSTSMTKNSRLYESRMGGTPSGKPTRPGDNSTDQERTASLFICKAYKVFSVCVPRPPAQAFQNV